MKTIEIDEEVFAFLQKEAIAFVETPNDTLRRILNLSNKNKVARRSVNRSTSRKKRKTNISELVNAGLLNNGQRLILIDYQKNKYPKYEVNISGNKLIWKNEAYSPSELAKILLKKEDYTSESVRGPQHWETENRISIKELWATYLSK